MPKLPVKCPGCNASLKVSELHCAQCNTEVCGSFELPPLIRLSEKEQNFIIDFIRAGGSLKEMAKNMNLSYPTVRNLLDDLIDKLA